MGVMISALNVIGVNTSAQMMVKGVVIIVAVILDTWNQRINERKAVEE